jgi:hypothetical protein
MFRVCLAQGCFGSDSLAAVSQAISDGVNVINFSISGGGSPYGDAVELAFLDATNAGISVNASAGNSGPGAGTAGHGGPWVTTVGASTGPRNFGSTLHLTADGGATLDVPEVTLTNGITSSTPAVMANTLAKAGGGTEDALCQSDLAAGAATGVVVVCNRGTNGRIDKGRRVLQGGAAGMILTNNSASVHRPRVRQSLPAGDPDPVELRRGPGLRDRPHERDGDVGSGNRSARPGRRDGIVLVSRAGRRLDQAGRDGSGRPGPRGNDAAA